MSWEHVRLGDLGTWYGGGTPSKSRPDFWTDGSIPWLSPKDMDGDIIQATQDHITEAAVAGSSTKLVPANSVAVVARSGILERTVPIALVPFATTLNQDMKALAPREGVDPRWIAWGLRSMETDLLRGARKAGTTVASLEWPRFLGFELPIPPFDEQRRIVAILEDHLSRLDAATASLEIVQVRSAALIQRVLEDSVRGQARPLREIAEVQGGTQKQPKRAPVANHYPFLRVANVTAAGLDLDEVHRIELFGREIDRYRLERGDLLVVEGNGSASQIGRAAIWDGSIPDAVHQNHLIRVRPGDSVLSEYLEVVWNSPGFRAGLSRAAGSSSGLHTLSVGKLEQLMVPTPSTEDQRAIVATVDDVRGNVARTATAVISLRSRSEALRRSLLAAAFRGEL